MRLECNPEIPVAPGEEHWLLDTSLDEVYWPCTLLLNRLKNTQYCYSAVVLVLLLFLQQTENQTAMKFDFPW